ncbi:MAG: hypothetical protein MUP70_00375 [Candidatus Aminicenantes bacterium]|nr:hypothetical protein [Candidatus Aminicenantes bacterium]
MVVIGFPALSRRDGRLLCGMFLVFFLLQPLLFAQVPYSLEKAQKVLKIIDAVLSEQQEGRIRTSKAVVTEDELNAYIAYRIDVEREEVMKELQLKIFADNRLEGKVAIDLRGQNLPFSLKPKMAIFFSADLEIKDASVRLHMKEIFLEGQKIEPALLDLIIAIGARLSNDTASSIGDWYYLPYGIKDLRTEQGKAVFYFQ